jgi:hypothetical protein
MFHRGTVAIRHCLFSFFFPGDARTGAMGAGRIVLLTATFFFSEGGSSEICSDQ